MNCAKRAFFYIMILTAIFAGSSASAHAGQSAEPATRLDAFFLGTKGETSDFFLDMLNTMMKEHITWRQSFHPEDPQAISDKNLAAPEATNARKKLKEVLSTLSTRMQKGSNPWFSPRYLGHMNADLLLPGVIGYMAAMLYNSNNVVYEGGPATTEMELEVGLQLARLLGYNPEKAWGNITSGGTNANFQALWYARNLKSFPLAVKAVMPELVKGLNEERLLNMPVSQSLDLLDKVKNSPHYETVLKHTVKGIGVDPKKLGKLLVPQSRHYSWDKAADVFGIGSENIIAVPVDKNYRMDIEALDRTIAGLVRKKIPILAVVSVLGSTEEGAVDETHRIAALREKYARHGIGFYYHIDAAYGGYVRSMFIDGSGAFMSLDQVRKTARERYQISEAATWPQESVYEAYKAVPEADSVTIDCHKLGYIPYPAGAVVFKDKRILAVQTFHAAYVQDLRAQAPVSIGHYVLEGSKPGAAAAAAWTAHQVLPLNMDGYGRLLGRTIKTANMLYEAMAKAEPFQAQNGRTYKFVPLVKPDLNIVDYVLKEVGNPGLEAMNKLNQAIYDECSYVSGDLMKKDFITSKTVFSPAEYGNTPLDFVRKCGLADAEWEKTPSVLVLRSTIMTPYLADEAEFASYFDRLVEIMKKVITKVGG
ncbi:MAG: pyridoxal-dependent decarboxylase [Syntrophales bacterium]